MNLSARLMVVADKTKQGVLCEQVTFERTDNSILRFDKANRLLFGCVKQLLTQLSWIPSK